MNSAAKSGVLILIVCVIGGCNRKPKASPPAAAQAPSLPVSTLAKNTPPPQFPPAKLPAIEPPPAKTTAPPPEPKPEKHSRHKPRHITVDAGAPDQSTPASTPTPAPAAAQPAATEQASNGASSDITPIGQLAGAGESTNIPRQNQILNEISSTEKGLNDIKRPLSKDEQTTATQIRTFLEKAKDSMKQEDLVSANILVTKAKVLLAELTNP